MAEYRYSGYASKYGDRYAETLQMQFKQALEYYGLTVLYCAVTRASEQPYYTSTNYVVGFGVTSNEIDSTVATKVNNAINSIFSSHQISLTGRYGAGVTPTTPTTPTTYGNIITTILGGVNPNPTSGGTSQTSGGIYTVKAGDTLSKIGAKLGIRWQDIAAWNNLKSPYIIQIGQVLRISGGTLPASQNNNPVILQPSQLPSVLTNQTQPQPQPQGKKIIDSFFDTTTGKLTAVGIAALILVGGIVLIPKK